MGSGRSISVIIVNYNGKELLAECLDSISRQALQPLETILVDNGSGDGSAGFVRRHYPGVRIIENSRNLGFAKGNNIGIREARGRYIALINTDAVADVMWLKSMADALERDAKAGFCASRILNYYDRTLIDSAGDLLGISRAFKRGHGRPDSGKYAVEERIFGACAGAALYRMSMLEDTGLFDESFISNLEDVDLSFRAQLKGYACIYVPSSTVWHKTGETKRKMGWTGRLTHRNNKLFWIKNIPGVLFLKYLPRMILNDIKLFYGHFMRLFRGDVSGGIRAFLILAGAYLEVMVLLPSALVKRVKIQKDRKVPIAYIDDQIRIGEASAGTE